ncbi:hypothetical protein BS78_06G004900 [Paspalum vaginatum]|nr:hypothetical protein BS78_06G004900 [Paspalum vaginatum]
MPLDPRILQGYGFCRYFDYGCRAPFSLSLVEKHEWNCPRAPYSCPYNQCGGTFDHEGIETHLRGHNCPVKNITTLGVEVPTLPLDTSYCLLKLEHRDSALLLCFSSYGRDAPKGISLVHLAMLQLRSMYRYRLGWRRKHEEPYRVEEVSDVAIILRQRPGGGGFVGLRGLPTLKMPCTQYLSFFFC